MTKEEHQEQDALRRLQVENSRLAVELESWVQATETYKNFMEVAEADSRRLRGELRFYEANHHIKRNGETVWREVQSLHDGWTKLQARYMERFADLCDEEGSVDCAERASVEAQLDLITDILREFRPVYTALKDIVEQAR